MLRVKTLSYTHARGSLAATMKSVVDDHAPVVITRQKGEAVVMMSLADYSALAETNYLLQSPANARRLLDSMDQLRKGKTVPFKVPLK
jgi:antitoxin YefM